MKFCKDCKYCAEPTNPESNCKHPLAVNWISNVHSDVVTGERSGENVYERLSCSVMREDVVNGGWCYNAELFVPTVVPAKLTFFDKIARLIG